LLNGLKCNDCGRSLRNFHHLEVRILRPPVTQRGVRGDSSLTLAKMPSKGGLWELAAGLQALIFDILRPRSPTVSGGQLKSFLFRQAAVGDSTRSKLRGRRKCPGAAFSLFGSSRQLGKLDNLVLQRARRKRTPSSARVMRRRAGGDQDQIAEARNAHADGRRIQSDHDGCRGCRGHQGRGRRTQAGGDVMEWAAGEWLKRRAKKSASKK
jgi:hypothetical protein